MTHYTKLTRSVCALFLGAALLATPASAYVRHGSVDSYTGRRALDTADPSGGPIAPHEPQQVVLEEAFSLPWGDFVIDGAHGFGIEALVLSRKDYQEGDLGALVPMDLALAWGDASDPAWVRHLRVTQGERLYNWSFPRGTALDATIVATHSANMHIMPANPDVLAKLETVGRGDLVRISGYLVNIVEPGVSEWKTSLTREDTGRGACEIILVESVEIVR